MTLVGEGKYWETLWQIWRDDGCSIRIFNHPKLWLNDCYSAEYIQYVRPIEITFNGEYYETDFVYKRKEGREVARRLIGGLWHMYNKYVLD
jgi:hypothetical protein